MKKYLLLFFSFSFSFCSNGEADNVPDDLDLVSIEESIIGKGVPDIFKNFYTASSIYLEGSFVVVEVNGAPDHKSPYYKESSMYEAYNGSNSSFRLNPNRISKFNFKYKIPLNPKEASKKEASPLGSMGVSINGVAFYNQYAGPNEPLTNEINSFDQYSGHPQPQGIYHYHLEPYYLTNLNGKDTFLGFLLDGFPVYGPIENQVKITNDDLDDYHGHQHATTDYPNGIYHYHITDDDPYINGNGFYGTPGTYTR